MVITLRSALSSDLPVILQLFRETVATICLEDYSPDQIRVWVARGSDLTRWKAKLDKQHVLVAEIDEVLVGFGSLEGNCYIDLMYVHKDRQGKGIASALLTALEQEALRHGVKTITSDVSKTARPFFERKGYRVITENTHVIDGTPVSNYRMEHTLP